MSKSTPAVEQNVPQPSVEEQPSIEELMKQMEDMKKDLAKKNSLIKNQSAKLDVIEKQREKMPVKLYKIHRKIYREWYNTIEARTVDEAKEIANSIPLSELFSKPEWVRVSKKSVSYKKKSDPVINKKTGEPYRTKKDEDDEDNKKTDNKTKKVKSNKTTKAKPNNKKKKNAKKK